MKTLILILAIIGTISAEIYTHKLPPKGIDVKEFCYKTYSYSDIKCADVSLWKEDGVFFIRFEPKDGLPYKISSYSFEAYQDGYFADQYYIDFYQARDGNSFSREIYDPATYLLSISDSNLDINSTFRFYRENNVSNYIEVNPTKQYETSTLTPTKSYIDALPSGWNLVGTAGTVNGNSAFSSAKAVYTYEKGAWQKYNPTSQNIQMQAFQGFWLLK